jgi:nitroreductase
MIKEAHTTYPVIDVIKNRWSNRSFSERPIDDDGLKTLFEAASWAPSANNEQPWEYYYAQKSNSESYAAILDCLLPGNQVWADKGDTIIISIARKNFLNNERENYYAKYDVGAANYGLLLQAQTMGIYGHIMAGYNAEKIINLLTLPEHKTPVAILVLGYLGNPEQLNEPFLTREKTPRSRRKIEEFSFKMEG